MNKFQIVVVGRAGVGKRSLKRQFAILNSDAKKQADKAQKNSQKLDDVPCAFNVAIVESKDQSNKAGLIQKGHAFVIVYSVEDKASFDCVASWRDDIIALKNEMVLSLSVDGDDLPPIVICANKSDVEDGRVVTKSQGEGLSLQLKSAFYEISCSTTKNIGVVYQHMVTELQSYRRRRVKQRNGYSDKKSLKKTKKKKGAPKGKITLEGHTFDLDKPSTELVEHLMRRLESKENGTSQKSTQVNKRLSQLSEENARSKRLITEHKSRVEDLEKTLEDVRASLKEEEQKTAEIRRKLAKNKRKKLKEREEKAEMEVKLRRMREDVKKWKAQCGAQNKQIDYLETELYNSERSRSRGGSDNTRPTPDVEESDSDEEVYSTPQRTLSASVLNYKIDLADIITSNELGKGSYGIVRDGFWRGCRIAVKQLLSSATQLQQEAFYKEAERLSLLRPHPHVVQFLGATTESDSLCIVTELIEAGTLLKRLQDISWTISPSAVKKIILGIAAGMLHLHKEGIIHRDLATRNILMSDDDHVKISDFGYARQLVENEDQNTTEQNLGPFRWMAPESMVGSQGKFLYSKAGDVWMFAVVLYEIFYREVPYADKSFTEVVSGKCQTKDLLLPIPDIPVIKDIMTKGQEYDPKERPTFVDIVKSLHALDEEHLIPVPPGGIVAGSPCVLRIAPAMILNKMNPLICSVTVEEGVVQVGTLLYVPSKKFIEIGTIAAIFHGNLQEEKPDATKGQRVMLKIQQTKSQRYEYGKHFDSSCLLYSKIPRETLYIFQSLVKR